MVLGYYDSLPRRRRTPGCPPATSTGWSTTARLTYDHGVRRHRQLAVQHGVRRAAHRARVRHPARVAARRRAATSRRHPGRRVDLVRAGRAGRRPHLVEQRPPRRGRRLHRDRRRGGQRPGVATSSGVRRTYDRGQFENAGLQRYPTSSGLRGLGNGLAYVIRDSAHPLPGLHGVGLVTLVAAPPRHARSPRGGPRRWRRAATRAPGRRRRPRDRGAGRDVHLRGPTRSHLPTTTSGPPGSPRRSRRRSRPPRWCSRGTARRRRLLGWSRPAPLPTRTAVAADRRGSPWPAGRTPTARSTRPRCRGGRGRRPGADRRRRGPPRRAATAYQLRVSLLRRVGSDACPTVRLVTALAGRPTPSRTCPAADRLGVELPVPP